MIAFVSILHFILIYVIMAIWVERKLSAFIQDRLGPMETGPKGLLQSVADVVKLLQKEDIVPTAADRLVFYVAPVVIFTAVVAGFAVMPIAPGFVGSDAQVGLFYLLAIVSIDVIGMLFAGWSSNNKFSLIGSLRAVAQIVSYEIPLGLTVLTIVMISQSLNLQEIITQQGIFFEGNNYLFGIKSWGVDVTNVGGIVTWNIVRYPLSIIGLIIFFIASLAEANRAPFDIPEAESEIIAGFQTEYSGFRWSMIMLGEYGMMLLVALLGTALFLGGWNTILPNIGGVKLADWTSGTPGELSSYAWGAFWMISKALTWVSIQIWARWTFPRLRVDHLMHMCWKVLVPISVVLVFGAAIWRLMMV